MHSNAALWSNVMKQKLKIVNDPRILQFIDDVLKVRSQSYMSHIKAEFRRSFGSILDTFFTKFKNLKFHERGPYIWKFGCSNQNWICHEHRNLPSVVFTITRFFTFQAHHLKSDTVFTQHKSPTMIFSNEYTKITWKMPEVITENVFSTGNCDKNNKLIACNWL